MSKMVGTSMIVLLSVLFASLCQQNLAFALTVLSFLAQSCTSDQVLQSRIPEY